MARKGMDPGRVESMAASMDNISSDIESAYATALGAVQEFDWVGADADDFKGRFENDLRGVIDALKRSVEEHAEKARSNIKAQEQASSQ